MLIPLPSEEKADMCTKNYNQEHQIVQSIFIVTVQVLFLALHAYQVIKTASCVMLSVCTVSLVPFSPSEVANMYLAQRLIQTALKPGKLSLSMAKK